MSPHYKLIYFNARGRAEHIRLIFAYSGIEYEDYRIPKERWPEYKKSESSDRIEYRNNIGAPLICEISETPFGMLPILEIDGKVISQSNAISRFLAQKYGLTGKDEWEALQCDVLVDSLGDLKQGMRHLFMGVARQFS